MVVTILNLKVKQRSFRAKTRAINLSTLNMLNHAETRNCAFIYKKKWKRSVFWWPFFCFATLKLKDTEKRTVSERFKFSIPKLCKNKVDNKFYTWLHCKIQCFRFQSRLSTHILIKGCNISILKKGHGAISVTLLQIHFFNVYATAI